MIADLTRHLRRVPGSPATSATSFVSPSSSKDSLAAADSSLVRLLQSFVQQVLT